MNRMELRKLIREEVELEIYRLLPGMLKQALTEVLGSQVSPSTKRKSVRLTEQTDKPFDPMKLKSMLGYGDMTAPRRAAATPTTMIAGVPVDGGLMAQEAAAGYVGAGMAEGVVMDAENAAAGTAPVPEALVQALGKRAKAVLAETERRGNWRPGKH